MSYNFDGPMNEWVFQRAQELIATGMKPHLAYVLARREWHEQPDPEVYELPE